MKTKVYYTLYEKRGKIMIPKKYQKITFTILMGVSMHLQLHQLIC